MEEHAEYKAERDGPRRVLLGVCGGVAAYKAPDLVRRLIGRGFEVRVVMTRAARQFVSPVTFQAVSAERVRADLWDQDAEAAMGHIELARWADLVLVAPATAHFMSALAHGQAADLLETICLATEAPIAIAPAMNRVMWSNAAVQDNRDTLERHGVRIIGPGQGEQACGEHGLGRMLEPGEIIDAIAAGHSALLRGLKVVVTAGPTREPIDPVRYITNRSSGKMGFALASAARAAGAETVLVSGPVSLNTPHGVRRIDVETAEQMYAAVHKEMPGTQVFIACAAVSDYKPSEMSEKKIKRSQERLEMALVRSPDTLASVAALEAAPFTVGFAAETNDVAQHAREKLERKGVDMIAANRVGPSCGFDKETNELVVLWPGGEAHLGEGTKRELAKALVALIAQRYAARHTSLAASGSS